MPVPSATNTTVRRPGSGAEVALGQRGGVRVVLDDDRQPDPVGDPVGDRRVAPGQVRREPDAAPVRGDEPGQRQPDGRRPGAAPSARR